MQAYYVKAFNAMLTFKNYFGLILSPISLIFFFTNRYLRTRDVFVPSFVSLFVCLFVRSLPSLQFALTNFYADCPHKRII